MVKSAPERAGCENAKLTRTFALFTLIKQAPWSPRRALAVARHSGAAGRKPVGLHLSATDQACVYRGRDKGQTLCPPHGHIEKDSSENAFE